jgi:NADPH:quinone reductase-like Zn-dependent oxidoreductase
MSGVGPGEQPTAADAVVKKVMFPIPKEDPEMVEYFEELVESGEFKPLIDRRYPLDQIVEAYRCVETGQKLGNVAVSVDASN